MGIGRQDPPRASRRRPGPALLGLVGGAAASGVLATVLARRTAELLATGPWRIESVVEAAVTAGGTVVAGWLAASATLALLCVLARLAGSSWRAGERLVHRAAPALVRRALVVAVGAGLGLTGATAAGAVTPTPTPVAVTQVAATPTADLGWAPTGRTGTSPAQTGAVGAPADGTAAAVPFLPETGRIVDLGSGAGLPGVVIAAMRPSCEVVLLEP
ncbi:RsmG family class I SAM-dependent methyltransferase, partial [Cellulomonas fimi]|uniref:RsmG family class I SAM-dependent methyltransferase n=1 Tax=Cellulomonas fimi TaxID=1708 RepID=UPI002017BA6F